MQKKARTSADKQKRKEARQLRKAKKLEMAAKHREGGKGSLKRKRDVVDVGNASNHETGSLPQAVRNESAPQHAEGAQNGHARDMKKQKKKKVADEKEEQSKKDRKKDKKKQGKAKTAAQAECSAIVLAPQALPDNFGGDTVRAGNGENGDTTPKQAKAKGDRKGKKERKEARKSLEENDASGMHSERVSEVRSEAGAGAVASNGIERDPHHDARDDVAAAEKVTKRDRKPKKRKSLPGTEMSTDALHDGAAQGSTGDEQQPKGAAVKESFRRVKSEEWVGKRGSMDNTYVGTFGTSGWGYKAQQVLGQVRGRDFRHEKTKKKRGSYFGGKIDASARFSMKYDSD